MQINKVRGLYGRPMNPKDENKVIGPRKSNEVSNSPWECRVIKKGQGSPKKASGPRMPKRKTKGTQEPISRKN